MLPVGKGVSITSLLTVSDDKAANNGFELTGIPDGMGAIRQGQSFVLLNNQELNATAGAGRQHGQKGAFVSRWEIDRKTFQVKSGSDFIQSGVTYWDYPSQTYGATPSTGGPNPRLAGDTFIAQVAAFARFCSSSLTDEGQLYNKRTGNGYDGRIYFANEENGNEA